MRHRDVASCPPVAALTVARPAARRRLRRREIAAAVCFVAFALVAAAFATGLLNGLDEYAVRHLMPGLSGRNPGNPDRIVNRVANVVMSPANALRASVLFVLVLVVLAVRTRTARIPLAWLAAYATASAAELLGKTALHRPPLSIETLYGSFDISKFDSSLPSGHTLRAILLASAIAAAWPALRALAGLWLASVVVMLELAGTHAPSDILGGCLLAAGLVLLCPTPSGRVAWQGRGAER